MLAVKIDLLMKRLDDRAAKKEPLKSIVEAMDSHMMCEVCGEVVHLGNVCHETVTEPSNL